MKESTSNFFTLAIETSCDETSASVLEGERGVCSNIVSSQIDTHRRYGGVVPELASRMHIESIQPAVEMALAGAGCTLADIDLIAVTQGPGLVGALLVGVSYAKGLAVATGKPIVAVNHMEGHIASNYRTHSDLAPPYIALVISGGHTYVLDVLDYDRMVKLGETRDDAVGEAFDKVARVLGLPYPGGAALETMARTGRADLAFPRVFLEPDAFDFSFSGLKTAVLNYLHTAEMKGESVVREDVAASFQAAVFEVLIERALRACAVCGRKAIAVSGGVSNNRTFFERLSQEAMRKGIRVFAPEARFTGDNAAMIGCAGYLSYRAHGPSTLDFTADPNLGL